MSLIDQILSAIKQEISGDPEKRGYAGKTDEEIAVLLNESYTVQVPAEHERPPRIATLLQGLAHAPNAAETKDIADAKTIK